MGGEKKADVKLQTAVSNGANDRGDAQPSRKRRRTEHGHESSSSSRMNGSDETGGTASKSSSKRLSWDKLNSLFGEQILPYSKVGRFLEDDRTTSHSLERLFL